MNENISNLFNRIETRLIESFVIIDYQIIRREISPDDGKLRIKSSLAGNGLFECFLYVKESGGFLSPIRYSFHWQDAAGKLVRRWDNSPHHLELVFAPNHLHLGVDQVEGFSGNPDIFRFIEELEIALTGK
ncbi:MAG: DUF6516 family protein [Thermodesulfobacteriota bacterium]